MTSFRRLVAPTPRLLKSPGWGPRPFAPLWFLLYNGKKIHSVKVTSAEFMPLAYPTTPHSLSHAAYFAQICSKMANDSGAIIPKSGNKLLRLKKYVPNNPYK